MLSGARCRGLEGEYKGCGVADREHCAGLAMLRRGAMVLECWCCPRHADRECCAMLAMLLLVMKVLVCRCCPRHADREHCAVLAMLLLVAMVLVF